jgi:hypothetical protein
MRPYLEKTYHTHKKGLVEWLKVKALSSSLSTTKKKKKLKSCRQKSLIHLNKSTPMSVKKSQYRSKLRKLLVVVVFVLQLLGTELRALHLLGKCPTV